MQFPSDFIEKYNKLLGDEAEDFFASFDQEPVSAYRTNPLKKQQKNFPDAIPETPWGHYGKISGKSADHATGLVYSQEPVKPNGCSSSASGQGKSSLRLGKCLQAESLLIF